MTTQTPEVIVKRTRLKAGREAAYEEFHRVVPAEVANALRTAGVHQWRIVRSGRDLIHVITADSRARMRTTLAADPVIRAWNARAADFLETLTPEESNDAKDVWTLS